MILSNISLHRLWPQLPRERGVYPLGKEKETVVSDKGEESHVTLMEEHVKAIIEEVGSNINNKNLGLVSKMKLVEAQVNSKEPTERSPIQKEEESFVNNIFFNSHDSQTPYITALTEEEMTGCMQEFHLETVVTQKQQVVISSGDTDSACMQIKRYKGKNEGVPMQVSNSGVLEVEESSYSPFSLFEEPIPLQVNDAMSE
ncbi:hypothetical protein HAX54_022917 [Datura stramonium]|uniref:Uncharacterized protein n=1 Tax=Datura stramonium TaxID=4076 RepID=A0ABS8UX30_DATST|nr:hypothetical protein [Datura stramonium]